MWKLFKEGNNSRSETIHRNKVIYQTSERVFFESSLSSKLENGPLIFSNALPPCGASRIYLNSSWKDKNEGH